MGLEQEEVARTDCFLCRPAGKLLVDVGLEYFTMAGLGPLSDGYAIVATMTHPDEEDNPPDPSPELAEYAASVHEALVGHFGSCVMTEHGRMPMCQTIGSHCFHQHFLFFPGVPDPLKSFRKYFEFEGISFDTLSDALTFASTLSSNYLLVSANCNQYWIFPAADGLPRQFSRVIIAEHVGSPDLASWQTYPNAEWSIKNAEVLRKIFERKSLRESGNV